MKKINIYKLAFIFVISLGFLCRSYIAFNVPIWHDEAFSIWAASNPIKQILSGNIDPVHTPGYYLLLKAVLVVSDHLFFFRCLTLLFYAVNCFLIYTLINNAVGKYSGIITTSFYAMSGYFVIFDWQVRMYTPILSCMLISQILNHSIVNKSLHQNRHLVLFTIINLIGLYLDYAYIWYFFPLLLIYVTMLHKQTRTTPKLVASMFLSCACFIAIYPQIFSHLNQGVKGIGWMKPYMSPLFFIPYFSGILWRGWMITVILSLIIGLAVYIVFRYKNQTIITLLIISSISAIFTLSFSIINTPLFHVRSLQIVGFTILVLVSYSSSLLIKKIPKMIIPLCLVQCIILIVSTYSIMYRPGTALIQFFPWKNVIRSSSLNQYPIIRYVENKNTPTSKLAWGLDYSLSGKESFPIQKFNHIQSFAQDIPSHNCTLIQRGFVDIYGCKQ